MRELPSMSSAAYSSTHVDPFGPSVLGGDWGNQVARAAEVVKTRRIGVEDHLIDAMHKQVKQQKEVKVMEVARRVVQIYIADPNRNVPLEDCLLYKGEPFLTDLNDTELFYELDIKAILTTYNEKRVKMVDKTVKDRTEYLEPAKVRDLRMVVVKVAEF